MYTCVIFSTEISSIYIIKYPYLVNLFTMTSIILYICPVTRSFNFSNFIIKSYNITSHSLLGVSTGCSSLYGLYLLNLFLWQSRHSFIIFLIRFYIFLIMYFSFIELFNKLLCDVSWDIYCFKLYFLSFVILIVFVRFFCFLDPLIP